jgi:hypothetical protein
MHGRPVLAGESEPTPVGDAVPVDDEHVGHGAEGADRVEQGRWLAERQ